MPRSDWVCVEKILLQLEDMGLPGAQCPYRFYKEKNHLCLLGTGATSYVVEMAGTQAPDRRYALKITGLNGETADPEEVRRSAQIQYHLSEQSEHIARVIDLWLMKIIFDEAGDVRNVTGFDEEGYDTSDGLPVQMILMERLDHVLTRDKFGHAELTRGELKTESGVIDLAKQIGRAVFTVHSSGFLHRDIKLENIFWDPKTARYQLGDFGVARYVEDGDAETVLFTDGYGAPEIEKRLRESYDATADIYSFGITLYLLLNDLRFPGSDAYHASPVQYDRDFIPPAPVHASEQMAAIIRKMCSYQPEDRYQSVEEILMELGRVDGTYTECGFTEEEELATEAYHETDHVSPVNAEDDPAAGDSWERAPSTREKRIRLARFNEMMYRDFSREQVPLFSILFFMLFKALSPEAQYTGEWSFWLLPLAMIAAGVLQRLGDFYVGAGLAAVGAAMFSMMVSGIDVPQVVLIMTVLLGVPAITAGCGAGIALWILQMTTGKWEWLGFLSRWDLGWLTILILIGAAENYIFLRELRDRKTTRGEVAFIRIIDHLWMIPVIAGTGFLLLENRGLLTVPAMIGHLHLIRCGVGTLLIHVFFLWAYDKMPWQNREEDR